MNPDNKQGIFSVLAAGLIVVSVVTFILIFLLFYGGGIN